MARVLVASHDHEFRSSVARLLRSSGYDVETLAHAAACVPRLADDLPACIVLELQLPKVAGLEVHAEFVDRGFAHPVVFVSERSSDVTAAVEAMKRGAIDVLVKPISQECMLDAVRRAIESDENERRTMRVRQSARELVSRLTSRERDVLGWVMTGLLNKQIAAEMGIAESTVKVHRSRLMEKLGVDSVIALMRLCDLACPPQRGDPSGRQMYRMPARATPISRGITSVVVDRSSPLGVSSTASASLDGALLSSA